MDDNLSALESRLAPDPAPDQLIANCRRRRREWLHIRRELEVWLAAHAETEEPPPA